MSEQTTSVDASDQEEDSPPSSLDGADTVQIPNGAQTCPHCQASNTATDRFCTTCGSSLQALGAAPPDPSSEGTDPEERTASLPPQDPTIQQSGPTTSPSRRRTWLGRLVATIAVVAIGATAAFAVMWRNERSHAHRLQRSLNTTQASLASTRTSLARTRAQLGATTAVANRRRTVLLQAKQVLLKVDPLLSSVDNLQSKAQTVQGDSGTLVSDAETLIQTTISLVNYLVATNTDAVDYTYVDGLISDANSELDSVRADEAVLSVADGGYGTASTAFGNRADSFSTSVRSLQKELNGVTGK